MAQYKSYLLFVCQVSTKDNVANSSDNTHNKPDAQTSEW
jgi:hypothetical protein